MLHNVLGFGGRLGRLEYFIFSTVLVVVLLLPALALLVGLGREVETIVGGGTSSAPPGLILTVAILLLLIYLWFALAFQAKRLRDIGWNPVHVMPVWIGAIILDRLVAFAVPALALGAGSGTLVGALLNLFMTGAVLFWPSGPSSADDWDYGTYHRGSPESELARETGSAPRRAVGRSHAPAPSGFGRRGL